MGSFDVRWLIALLFGVVGQAFAAEQPNLIFILVDDLRYDGMGFVQGDIDGIRTPHIDQLAAQGMYLSNAVVTTSLCSPSRATILTGQSTRNHRIVDNNDTSEDHLLFFPRYLQNAGYETAFVGKWHMGRSNDNPRSGFDHWVSFIGQGFYNPTDSIPPAEIAAGRRHQLNVNGTPVDQTGYITDELTDYAVDWLSGRDGEQPFFLYLSHKAVHSNVTPAPRHQAQYADVDFSLVRPDGDQGAPGAGKPMWVHNQRNSWHGIEFAYHSDSPMTDYMRRYFATLSSVDDSVGRLVAWLRENDEDENTILVFYSDNGFLFGEHGLIDKRNAYEPSVRVPMVVYGPGRVPAGTTVASRVRNLDLAPTFIDLAGGTSPEQFEGRSIAPLITGQVSQEAWASEVFVYEYYWEWTFPQTPTTFAITKDEIKYIQYHGLWDLEELYDLRRDPHEHVNLIDDIEYRNALIDRRELLYQHLANSQGEAVVPFSEKRSTGIGFRKATGSSGAPFPPQWLKAATAPDRFQGFVRPARIEEPTPSVNKETDP